MHNKASKMKDVNRVFNRKIIVEKRTVIKDELKQETEVWEKYCDLWVDVNNLYGNEYYAAKSLNEEKTLVFICRFNELINNINTIDYRVVFDRTVLDIKHIDNMRYKNNIFKIKALERGLNV